MLQKSKVLRFRNPGLFYLALFISLTFFASCRTGSGNDNAEAKIDTVLTGTVTAELTNAPNVPKPLTYTSPKKVMVQLETIEKVMPISDSSTYTFCTLVAMFPATLSA